MTYSNIAVYVALNGKRYRREPRSVPPPLGHRLGQGMSTPAAAGLDKRSIKHHMDSIDLDNSPHRIDHIGRRVYPLPTGLVAFFGHDWECFWNGSRRSWVFIPSLTGSNIVLGYTQLIRYYEEKIMTGTVNIRTSPEKVIVGE